MIIKMSDKLAVDLLTTMASVRGAMKMTMPNFDVEQTSYGNFMKTIASGLASGREGTVADITVDWKTP